MNRNDVRETLIALTGGKDSSSAVQTRTIDVSGALDWSRVEAVAKRSGNGRIGFHKDQFSMATVAAQESRVDLPVVGRPRALTVHFALSAPANLSDNFYVDFGGGEDAISLRVGNTSLCLCDYDGVHDINAKVINLFSVSVDESYVCLHLNQKLLKRKRKPRELGIDRVTFRLIGDVSADLEANIHGLAILNGSTDGLREAPASPLEALKAALDAGDMEGVHEWIMSFDDVDFSMHHDRLLELLTKQLNLRGHKEWLVDDTLAKLPPAVADRWRQANAVKIPQPAIVIDQLSVRFFRYPNKRLSVSRLWNKELSKTFDVLNDINFNIYPGDVLGIIGSNGAGKSTLLRAISGLIPIRKGRILVNGRHLLLSPGLGIRAELSGRDNIFLACCFMGLSLKEAEALYPEIVEFSELEKSIEQPFKFYSDGMKSRLIFSIATSVGPDILMLDELLNAGDIKFQKKAAKRMDELIARAKVVVVVTHSIPFVAEKCSKALLISGGRQLAYGPAKSVISRYYNELHMTSSHAPANAATADAMTQQLQSSLFLPG